KPRDIDKDKFNNCSTTDINKHKLSADQISVQLRYIQTSFRSSEELIKQSTTPDICEENFIQRNDRENITIIEAKYNELVSRFPGHYKSGHIFIEEELRYVVSVGPSQPILQHYPTNDILVQTKKTCRFAAKWYEEFPCLEYSQKKDAAFCFTCRLLHIAPGSEKLEEALLWIGVNNWTKMKCRGKEKQGKLIQHFGSVTHKLSLARYENFQNKKTTIDIMLANNRRKADHEQDVMLKLNKDVIITLSNAARYLAKQGLAFRRDPHLEGLPIEHEDFSLKG
ncbi:unnamed protein product, partial [Didymodactylos carnosus]